MMTSQAWRREGSGVLMESFLLARRIEERQLAHARGGSLALVLDRHFHFHFGVRREVRRAQVSEREIFLEQRRPAPARRVTDLLTAAVDRCARAPGHARQRGG